jgi:enoyl-CoA hydratase/carnithine racemase
MVADGEREGAEPVQIGPAGRVTVAVTAGVADVRLNRPDKLNALDPAMFAALVETGEVLRADPSVRAVVISGEGKAFCAGLDLGSMVAFAEDGAAGLAESLPERLAGRITNQVQEVAYLWRALAVPTIAAVHGVALGGGLQIALGADLRFVAPSARLSVLEIRWGLVPDMTGTYFLPRLVGPDVAKELTWTGRMVEGEEARRIGLATQVHDEPRGAALALAADLAGRSPEAVRGAKALIDASLGRTAAEQLVAESATMAGIIGAPNQTEAVRAFVEKRPARFADSDPDTGLPG